MAKRTRVTIENGHRYAVHVAGRRFRPGRPRTLMLTDFQLEAVRGNPWLWIEGEDYEDESSIDLNELSVPALKAQLKELDLPVSGKKAELVERLAAAQASEEE